jgi:hypothetical protein
MEDIELLGFIAKGASGAVYRGRWGGMLCAVKRFPPSWVRPTILLLSRRGRSLYQQLPVVLTPTPTQ